MGGKRKSAKRVAPKKKATVPKASGSKAGVALHKSVSTLKHNLRP